MVLGATMGLIAFALALAILAVFLRDPQAARQLRRPPLLGARAFPQRRASIAAAQTNQKGPLPHPSLFRALTTADASNVEAIKAACTKLDKRHWNAGGRGRQAP